MSTIKADPDELRRLANDLRQSGSRLRDLGDQAVAAAASARSPAAAGTIAEAAGFAAAGHLAEVQVGGLASGTERVASLFEAADRGGGFFSRAALLWNGGAGHFGRKLLGASGGLYKLYKNVPHGFSRAEWRAWTKKLTDARTNVGRYWGDRGVSNTLRSWGRAQWRVLRDPKAALTKFADRGSRAVKSLSKNTTVMRRVGPLMKFGGKIVGKVAKPFNIIQSYRNSNVRNPVGKVVSVAFSTALTKNPVGFVADLATGGQVTKGVDGVVNTIASVGDGDRLSAMSVANAKGENGWAMQGIQYAGDGLADGLYNGWNWVTHGH